MQLNAMLKPLSLTYKKRFKMHLVRKGNVHMKCTNVSKKEMLSGSGVSENKLKITLK